MTPPYRILALLGLALAALVLPATTQDVAESSEDARIEAVRVEVARIESFLRPPFACNATLETFSTRAGDHPDPEAAAAAVEELVATVRQGDLPQGDAPLHVFRELSAQIAAVLDPGRFQVRRVRHVDSGSRVLETTAIDRKIVGARLVTADLDLNYWDAPARLSVRPHDEESFRGMNVPRSALYPLLLGGDLSRWMAAEPERWTCRDSANGTWCIRMRDPDEERNELVLLGDARSGSTPRALLMTSAAAEGSGFVLGFIDIALVNGPDGECSFVTEVVRFQVPGPGEPIEVERVLLGDLDFGAVTEPLLSLEGSTDAVLRDDRSPRRDFGANRRTWPADVRELIAGQGE